MRTSSLFLVAIAACLPRPVSDVEPARENTPEACELACERLKAIGCPEGDGSLSGEPCTRVCLRAASLRALPLACWAGAPSASDARACGALRCRR